MNKAAFLAIFLFLLSIGFSVFQAHAEASIYINGTVLDATTGQPINNALVELRKATTRPDELQKIGNMTTDTSGSFIFTVKAGDDYYILVHYDDPETRGFDYAPVFKSITATENVALSLRLHPAASIVFVGDLLFVEVVKPSSYFSYTILGNGSGEEYLQSYGTAPPCHSFLGLPSNHVVVPIDCDFMLNLSAKVIDERGDALHSFVIDFGENGLSKGSLTEITLGKYSVAYNLNLTSRYLASSSQLLMEVEDRGFYVAKEKQGLTHAESLLGLANAMLGNGLYDGSYADVRESYLKVAEIYKSLMDIYANASSSVLVLLVFVNITAVALAFFLFKPQYMRYGASAAFDGILFAALYLVYPGCRLISTSSLLLDFLISLGISLCIASVTPSIMGDEVVSLFAMAKVNLKRRGLRFALALASVTILVLGFVSLTSFSAGYGLVVQTSWTLMPSPTGLILKHHLPSEGYMLTHFLPIETSTVYAVQSKPEVLTAAPKMENVPASLRIGYFSPLARLGSTLPLWGILGISPSAEADISHFDGMVIQGRFLRDEDENAVLISARAASLLEIELNSELTLSLTASRVNVTVVGFLDDARLHSAKDIGGEDLLPKKLVAEEATGKYQLETCSPEEVVVGPLRLTTKLLRVFFSRIGIVLRDWSSALPFSRQIALERDLAAFYSSGREMDYVYVGFYFEAKGASIFIPWVIVILSIMATILNAIYEQRREITILSSIGLNPSHISHLFAAEAAIIGFVGGSFGYLLGLGNYKIMSIFSIVPEVQAKVSAVWCLATVLASTATVIVGAMVALRMSAVVTPSLIRRWYLGADARDAGRSSGIVSQLPFLVRAEDLDSMFGYVVRRFKSSLIGQGANLDREGVSQSRENIDGEDIVRVKFNYFLGERFKVGGYPFELVAKRTGSEQTYRLEVACGGSEEIALNTITFVRLALIEWSSMKTQSLRTAESS